VNFASLDFLLFFAVVFVTYFSLPDKWRNAFLLAASYFFYAYWSWKYLLLLVFTMVLDFVIALAMDAAKDQARRKLLLVSSVVANLGILFLFKYFDFFTGMWAEITGGRAFSLNLVLPFGISFYTFHAMSYTIDVYRRVIPAERNFTFYSGYVMFFPQLVAGPIARASHLLHQFAEPKRLRFDNFVTGSLLIAKGYILKVVLADNLAPMVDAYLGTEMTGSPLITLQGVYFFAFQIYFDFSGYTNIARGVAKLFDFDLVLNFNRPYAAASITDFWKRWHISLSTWLRDYLYISLGGNRKGNLFTYRNLLLTMLLGGLWHGASLNFVIWGGLHGLYLIFERALGRTAFGGTLRGIPKPLRILATFHLVCLAWIFFRCATLHDSMYVLGRLWELAAHPAAARLSEVNRFAWILILGWVIFEWAEARFDIPRLYARAHWSIRFGALYAVLLFVVLLAQTNPKAFIYFQF
jgi:alginate O-acetyltransferase complex protein AlgI